MPFAPHRWSAAIASLHDRRTPTRTTLLLAVVVALVACGSERDAHTPADSAIGADRATGDSAAAMATAKAAADSARRAAPDTADLRVEIDLTQRRLAVIAGNTDTIARHRVAVGSPEWPTRTGSWAIEQVVLNPSWTPPDESWAEEREPKAPGAPDNPLGAAQLVYDLPRTIHGTDNPSSIGKAVSHGSIRVTNADALALARLMMDRTGVPDTEQRLTSARAQRTVKQVIDLPKVVPIRVF